MSIQQRLSRLEAKTSTKQYNFKKTKYFNIQKYLIEPKTKDEQPNNRTVKDSDTTDKYNYRKLKKEEQTNG